MTPNNYITVAGLFVAAFLGSFAGSVYVARQNAPIPASAVFNKAVQSGAISGGTNPAVAVQPGGAPVMGSGQVAGQILSKFAGGFVIRSATGATTRITFADAMQAKVTKTVTTTTSIPAGSVTIGDIAIVSGTDAKDGSFQATTIQIQAGAQLAGQVPPATR